jgi:hypothetical protein
MATNAIPTVTTAIHRPGAPTPAISMMAPMTMSTTAIQTKGVMAAPLLVPKGSLSDGSSEIRVDCQRHAAQSHSAPLCGAFGLTRDDGGFAAIGDS